MTPTEIIVTLECAQKPLDCNTTNRAPVREYRRPELHSLGALDLVQSYYCGSLRDGPNSYYWYM